MSINEFISTKNINLIWLVIQEEEIIQKQSNEFVEYIIKFIQSTLYDFYEKEKEKVKNLQEINKRFIIFILNYISSLIHKSHDTKNRVINLNETPELVTFEEIQKNKQNNFDRQLQEKQKEFSNAIQNKIPETPIFSDQIDTPLTESELLVKKMLQQRMMEEEYFKQSSTNDNWIKPVETSIKKTKIIETETSGPIKFIKIENEIDKPVKDIINLNSSYTNYNSLNQRLNNNNKHISWKSDLIEFENNVFQENLHELKADFQEEKKEINIFSKLKKTNTNEISQPNTEMDSLKQDIKIIFSKMEDINTTINNILVWMKENKSN